MKITVESAHGKNKVKVFMEIVVTKRPKGVDRNGIGFLMFDHEGNKVDRNHPLKTVYESGYVVTNDMFKEAEIPVTNGKPWTLVVTTYDKNKESSFRFSYWVKKSEGTVTMTSFSK